MCSVLCSSKRISPKAMYSVCWETFLYCLVKMVGVVEEDVFFTDAIRDEAKATLCGIWGDRFAERYVFLYSGFCHNGRWFF